MKKPHPWQLPQPEIRHDSPWFKFRVWLPELVTWRSSMDQRIFLMWTMAPVQSPAGSWLSPSWLLPAPCASTKE